MKQINTFLVVGATALALIAGSALAKPTGRGPAGTPHGGGKGRPERAVVALTIPVDGADVDASGKLDVKHFRAHRKSAERSWFRVRLAHLDGTDYTVWLDDPSTPETDLVELAAITAQDGYARYGVDTKHGGTLPFDATLADLAGKSLEVRDASGFAVLTGTVPAVR